MKEELVVKELDSQKNLDKNMVSYLLKNPRKIMKMYNTFCKDCKSKVQTGLRNYDDLCSSCKVKSEALLK